MTNIGLISALLSTLICFSSCVFHIVSVENGEDVNLNCTNVSSLPSHVSWFKWTDQPNGSKIASMKSSKSVATLYEGFQSGRFNMSSNSSTLILTIKEVGFSDSVLYLCGFVKDRYPVFHSATFLMVKEKSNSRNLGITVMLIVGALIIVLIGVIIAALVKMRKLQMDEDATTNEDVDTDALTYVSQNFQKAKRSRRSPPGNEPGSNTVYAAIR